MPAPSPARWQPLFAALLLAAGFGRALPAAGQPVVLNEVSPSVGFTDEDGDDSDWLELYNAGTAPVDLAGYGLSDDPEEPFRWRLAGPVLDPGAYLLVFASGKDRAGRGGAWETVVDRGHSWRYRTGATPPPANWFAPDFDDAAWRNGRSGFGYGDGDDATNVSTGTITVFVRTEFTVDDPSDVLRLFLHVDYDDAFVAYLNGEEVARANIGTAGTPPGMQEPSGADHEAQLYQQLPPDGFEVADPSGRLRPGRNVLAVEVHNANATSSDLTLVPLLTLALASPPAQPRGLSPLVPLPAAAYPHTSFALKTGETVLLTAPDSSRVDEVTLGTLPPRTTLGRRPDGTGEWVFFATTTPGAANPADGFTGVAAAPAFEPMGGFLPGSFVSVVLQPSDPADALHYTLDGAEPTQYSPRYTGAILRTQTTVVRARAFRDGLLPSPIATRTFLLREPAHLPVVSLVTDPPNLWDEQKGIYVMGPNASPENPHFGANFWQDWEVPVHVDLFETDPAKPGLALDAGMKIYGAWSRAHAQKSLALFARSGYGASEIAYPLFDERPYDRFESVILRNSGNDWPSTLFRDALMHRLVWETGVDVLAYRPVVVYLNGAYWGIQNLREKVNENYLGTLHGVDPDAIDLIELGSGENEYGVIEGSDATFQAFLAYLGAHGMTAADDYAFAASAVDLDEFTDYMIAQIFYANTDWPGNNMKLWRAQAPGGRWRWILYDTDFGFGLYDAASAYRHETLTFATAANGPSWPNPPHSTFVLRRLLLNETFRHAFINRFADHLNATFQPARVLPVIDAMQAVLEPEMPRHRQRWGGSMADWRAQVQVLRDFAERRPSFLWGHVRQYFRLPQPQPVAVEASPAEGGDVVVNRRLAVGSAPWSGRYFPGVPVTLTARPRAGYRFAGWTGAVEHAEATVQVDPAAAPSLTAHFEVDPAAAPRVLLAEIFYNPPPELDPEDWVELLNAGDAEADLSGWSFRDGDDEDSFTIPAGTRLAPDSVVVLCRDPEAFAAAYPGAPACLGGFDFGLSNGGDLLRLLDAAGALVDSVRYDDEAPWPKAPDGTGPSLELIDPDANNDLAAAWRSSEGVGGTPGRPGRLATAGEPLPEPPAALVLHGNHPNPFSGSTTIAYELPTAGTATLEVYNAMGQRVQTLVDAVQPAGVHTVRWNAAALSPGLYLYRLTFDGRQVLTRSAIRVR